MNFFKRLNTYLLENYPLIWHSKFIQLIFAGLVFWIISFCSGFVMINLKNLQFHHISHYYEASGFVYFHVVYEIVILSIWALYFYKNNAFKNYYPLKKGYFIILFSTLFVSFFILTSAYLPFTYGCETKARSLFDETKLKEDIDKLNIGGAFLISNPGDYYIENRMYPAPYPIDMISFDENTNSWTKIPTEVIIPWPDSLDTKTTGYSSDIIISKSDRRENQIRFWTSSSIDEKNTVLVNGRKMQFYKTRTEYFKVNECDEKSNTYLTKMYRLDELDQPELNSIINFSSVLLETPYRNIKNGFLIQARHDRYDPIIYKLIRTKNHSEIKKAINDFVKVCNKYQIENDINVDYLSKYLKLKNYKNFHNSIVETWRTHPDYFNRQNELENLHSSLSDNTAFITNMNLQHVYFFNKAGLDTMFMNHQYLILDQDNSLELLFFLYLSFFITWVFILFEFTSIKSLLLTIPVAGLLLILNVMIIIFTHSMENGAFIIFILTFLLIIALTLSGLKKQAVNKRVLNVLMILSYVIAPIFISVIVMFYYELTKDYTVYTECFGTIRERRESILTEPYMFFLYSVIGLLLFIPLLKKWKALEE